MKQLEGKIAYTKTTAVVLEELDTCVWVNGNFNNKSILFSDVCMDLNMSKKDFKGLIPQQQDELMKHYTEIYSGVLWVDALVEVDEEKNIKNVYLPLLVQKLIKELK